MTPKVKVSRDVRETLKANAFILFASRGYAGTTVADIVEASGVTKPMMYYYWGDKSELFSILVDEALLELGGFEPNAMTTDLGEALVDVWSQAVKFLSDRKDHVALLIGTDMSDPLVEFRLRLASALLKLTGSAARTKQLREGVTSARALKALVAAIYAHATATAVVGKVGGGKEHMDLLLGLLVVQPQ